MCLYLKKRWNGVKPKAKIAKRRIKCWKVVKHESDGCYVTPLRYECLSDDVIAGKCDFEAVGGGEILLRYDKSHYYVGEGYIHTFSELENAEYFISSLILSAKHEIYECEIPVGVEYFKSFDGKEYASRSIRFIRKKESHESDNE